MNMICEIKDGMRSLLSTCALDTAQVFTHAAQEEQALAAQKFPFAALITGDERFENDYTRDVRGLRVMPLEVRVYADSEDACMDIVEQLYRRIPVRWQYDGMSGEIALVNATHSDCMANITQYYACFIEIRFTMHVKTI